MNHNLHCTGGIAHLVWFHSFVSTVTENGDIIEYKYGRNGGPKLFVNGSAFEKHWTSKVMSHWRCVHHYQKWVDACGNRLAMGPSQVSGLFVDNQYCRCRARIHTSLDGLQVKFIRRDHNHQFNMKRKRRTMSTMCWMQRNSSFSFYIFLLCFHQVSMYVVCLCRNKNWINKICSSLLFSVILFFFYDSPSILCFHLFNFKFVISSISWI